MTATMTRADAPAAPESAAGPKTITRASIAWTAGWADWAGSGARGEATPRGDRQDIARLSVHLAALERAVLPTAASRLDDGPARVRELRARGRELARALHWLDRHLTGDAQLARWPTRQLTEAVQAAAADHAQSERAVVGALAETLVGPEMAELGKDYQRAALRAPTRPHPSLPARGLSGRIAFALAARVDAVRDGLDNWPTDGIRHDATRALADLDAISGSEDPARTAPGLALQAGPGRERP